MRLLVCALLVLSIAAAGCSSSPSDDADSDDSDMTLGGSTQPAATGGASSSAPTSAGPQYTLTVSNFPAVAVSKNSAFSFQLAITGSETKTSDHIGAHFGPSAVSQPTVAAYANACNHIAGDVPGNYVVTCTAPNQAGTYYLRGHLRLGADAATHTHSWASERTFTVS